MDRWKELPVGQKPPATITVVVEATKESRNTYNVNGTFTKLDRVLYSSITYPCDYGFIPRTMWEDGEPLRAMILTEYPTFPGCLVDARPIGILKISEKGLRKDKLIVAPIKDPEYMDIDDIAKVSKHILKEIEAFFRESGAKEKDALKLIGWTGRKEAERSVIHAMKIYDQKKD